MVNWPLAKRNEASRVSVKLNSVSVQWRTASTRSWLRLLINFRVHDLHRLSRQRQPQVRVVMRGRAASTARVDPRIHGLAAPEGVDGRHKAGHDESVEALAGNCDLDRIRQALAVQVNVELLLGDVINLAAPSVEIS